MRIVVAIILFSFSAIAGTLYTEGIIKKDLGLKPSVLVNEYVKRDANGEFLQTNEWWSRISGDHFTPQKEKVSHSFTVVKTDWGYKLDNKSYQMVRADIAFEKFQSQLNKPSIKKLKAIKVKKSADE